MLVDFAEGLFAQVMDGVSPLIERAGNAGSHLASAK